MKRMNWKTALFSGLMLSVGSIGLCHLGPAVAEDVTAESRVAQGGKREGGGGRSEGGGNRGGNQAGNQGGNQGGHQGGGRPSGSNRGGNAPHSGGGTRQPSGAGQRQPSNVVPRQAPVNRSPSFTRPNPGRQPSTGTSPVRIRPSVEVRNPVPGGVRPNGHVGNPRPGTNSPRDQSPRDGVNVRTEVRRPDWNQSRINNRPFTGNSIRWNDRDFNVGHNSYQPSHYRHPTYHGHWNGNWGQGQGHHSGHSGGYGWGYGNDYGHNYGYQWNRYRPFGWGLGGWGLGSLYYNSGYLGYSNPYYVGAGPTYYNYSQPIPVSYNAPVVVVSNEPDSADQVLSNAVTAFQQNDYDAALDITNQGITQYPDDAVLHEFRSLVLFAKRDYQQSAGTIHSVLAVGPGWDWTTLIGLYATASIYTDQLRELEAFTKANPQDAASHFLLAYHYMTCGHPEDAVRQLQVVVQLMPNDRVASDILKMIAAPLPAQSDGTTAPLAPPPAEATTRLAAVPAVAAASLVGTWKAARADGSTFDLKLTDAATFTWSFAQKNQPPQAFGGTYTVEGNVLALERKDGGSLIAEVTPGGDSKFNFKMLGAPAEDLGLDFQK